MWRWQYFLGACALGCGLVGACVLGSGVGWSAGVLLLLLASPLLYFVGMVTLWLRYLEPAWTALENNFPSPPRHWLYGNMHLHPGFGAEGIQWYMELTQKFVKSFVMWYGPVKPSLTIIHPEAMKAILKTAEPKALSFFGIYRFIRPWIGDGLLVSKGEKWFRNRRLLTPAFHFDTLKPYVRVYNEAMDIFLEKMMKKSEENGGVVEISSDASLCTLNVMLRCALSNEDDVQRMGNRNEYVNSVEAQTTGIFYRAVRPHLTFDWLFNRTAMGRRSTKGLDVLHTTTSTLIEERKRALALDPELCSRRATKDFLDILLMARDEDGQGLSAEEIRDEVDTFLFEGHDTTASAVSWILYALAGHPDVQERARQEVDAVMDARGDNYVMSEDLSSFPYLYQCIREGIRLHNPVPFVGRELEGEVEVDGVTLKPGTMVDILTMCLHHNEAVWGPDHDEFKPERFTLENMKKMDPYAYVPFSAGPRNCIGQNFAMNEIKVFVARVLRQFQLDVVPGKRPVPFISSVMRFTHGLYLRLTPRQ